MRIIKQSSNEAVYQIELLFVIITKLNQCEKTCNGSTNIKCHYQIEIFIKIVFFIY